MERDEETGLSYHGARYYAPWLGRWTAADPIGLGDGVNRYRYSSNNPVGFVDRTGGFTQDPEDSSGTTGPLGALLDIGIAYTKGGAEAAKETAAAKAEKVAEAATTLSEMSDDPKMRDKAHLHEVQKEIEHQKHVAFGVKADQRVRARDAERKGQVRQRVDEHNDPREIVPIVGATIAARNNTIFAFDAFAAGDIDLGLEQSGLALLNTGFFFVELPVLAATGPAGASAAAAYATATDATRIGVNQALRSERAAARQAAASGSRKNLPPKGTPEGDAARFDRYRAEGGQLSYDQWYPRSRGGRRGGPGHSEIQNRLESRGYEAEVQFGDRFADAYKDGEIHQIGGLNKRGDPIKRERDAINDILESERYNGEDIYFWDKTNPDPNAKPIKNPHLLPNWGG